MRNCPHCNIPLTEVEYSGLNVMYCGQCRGHLVDVTRLESIKRSARKPPADLKAEATEDYHPEPLEQIGCPRCHLAMEKRPVRLPGLTVHLDFCKACALVWLDGGELALLQLEHRTTPSCQDDKELKRRANALETDPERKAAFERNLAKLPDDAEPLKDRFGARRTWWAAELVTELAKLLLR